MCQNAPIPGCCERNADCDDGKPCTADVCSQNRCDHTQLPAGSPCDDGNACNGADTCDESGGCVGGPGTCDDGSACTTDICDRANGCQHILIPDCPCPMEGATCGGDVCKPLICRGGICSIGTPLDCDDGDECTADGCDGTTGCTHKTMSCDDNNPCTVNICSTSQCTVGRCLPSSCVYEPFPSSAFDSVKCIVLAPETVLCPGEDIPVAIKTPLMHANQLIQMAPGDANKKRTKRLARSALKTLNRVRSRVERAAGSDITEGCAAALRSVVLDPLESRIKGWLRAARGRGTNAP